MKKLFDKCFDLYMRYKEMILYIVFGGFTTLVNIVVYWLMYNKSDFSNMTSTIAAWILSVLFAFVTNKLFVFESKTFALKVLISEMSSFFLCRLATGLMDLGIMYVFVDLDIVGMKQYNIVIKILSNVLVIILNYIASKLLIFKKKQQ